MKSDVAVSRNSVIVRSNVALAFRPSIIVILLYTLLLGLLSLLNSYQALDYVHLGSVWGAHNASGTWGYDGQFYYQIARNPFGAGIFMDNAPYRYQRILYPLLAWLLSLGNVSLIPYALLFINLASICLSVEVVAQLLRKHGFSPWFALALGLYFGQAAALAFDTAEPLSILFLCLGIWYIDRQQLWQGAILLSLAALTRETSLLFPFGYVVYFFLQKHWKPLLLVGTISFGPILAWLLSLWLIFGQTGLTFSPPFEHVPFAGILFFAHAPRKFWLLCLLMLLPLLGNCLLLLREVVRLKIGLYLFIWLTNLAMIVLLSHFSYIELISCGRISTALVLATLIYGIKSQNRLILWSAQFYTLTFLVFLVGTMLHLNAFII
jgi:hypothetical protein